MPGGFFNATHSIVTVPYISEINTRFENYELIVLIFITLASKNTTAKMITVQRKK